MAEIVKIDPNNPDLVDIKRIASLIRSGGIVALPTETVYGLTCNLDNEDSVNRLYELKQRPKHKHFSIHVARKGDVDVYAKDLSAKAYRLVDSFWPGPLTLICNARSVNDIVGIRCPDHFVTSLILEASFAKVGMPSANISGEEPCLTAQEVEEKLGDKIALIVDTGVACEGISSTVLDVTKDDVVIVREGIITLSDIHKELKIVKVLFVCTGNTCRSAIAKYYFEDLWKKRLIKEMEVSFDSCGTMGMQHMPASYGATAVLKESGIDCSDHSSKSLDPEVIKSSDIVVAMTRAHRDIAKGVMGTEAKVVLLSDLIEDVEFDDLPDPVGGSLEEYKRVLGYIAGASEKLFEMINTAAELKKG